MTLGLLLALPALATPPSFVQVRPYAARTYAKLPDGLRYPEGIATDPHSGDIFVGTFDFGPNPNALLRYGPSGRLEATRDFGGTPLLGLSFNPSDRKVYLANFGASQIQRIDAHFDGATAIEVVADLPGIGAPDLRFEANPDGSEDVIDFGSNDFPGPNGLTFSADGTLYVSDSFQGAIYAIDDAATCSAPCAVTTVVQDPLLATAGFPPFGANGLALSRDGATLYVANTGDDRILAVDLGAVTVSVFAKGIDGADGLALDDDGTLWVAANQADRVVGLDATGRKVAELGAYLGQRLDGAARGLLFPASPVIVGHELFVTNLALPLTGTADEPEGDVTTYTVSRIPLP